MRSSVEKLEINLPSARVGAGSCRAALLLALYILPLTLLLLEDTGALAARLVFSNNTQVNSSTVFLEDIIADYNGDELLKRRTKGIIVASAPFPGKVKIIKKPQVLRALKQHELTAGNTDIYIPEEIKVTRKSSVFGIEEIESIIRNELLKNNFIDKKNTAFTVEDIQKEVALPYSPYIKTIVKIPSRIKELNKFWVSFYLNGRLKSRIWASGTIKRYLEVLAVNKSISANDIINDEDLIYMKKNILGLNGDYLTNKVAVVGKKALRNIPEGQIIKKSSVAAAPSVRAGDIVNIQARFKNLTVNTSGKVISPSGNIGDTVTVLNIDSKEKVQAVVVSGKTVMVEVR